MFKTRGELLYAKVDKMLVVSGTNQGLTYGVDDETDHHFLLSSVV